MNLILISGLSGSGKSVVLHFLEDNGFYAIDNLPAALLISATEILKKQNIQKIAVAIDARSTESIKELPKILPQLPDSTQFLFLTADDATLIKRFSELRRRHPLTSEKRTLAEAILSDRELTAPLQDLGLRLDTSALSPTVLRQWCREFLNIANTQKIALLFESFAYKFGIPSDADLVFDARCLPNPYYIADLKKRTGKEKPVQDFLSMQKSVGNFEADIVRFISNWLADYAQDDRRYLTIAIGCTGGQHRSVYLAEKLAQHFGDDFPVWVRHRVLDQSLKSTVNLEKI